MVQFTKQEAARCRVLLKELLEKTSKHDKPLLTGKAAEIHCFLEEAEKVAPDDPAVVSPSIPEADNGEDTSE